MTTKHYCGYCGRIAHRCQCADKTSRLQKFLALAEAPYRLWLRDKPYKRGVPPQVKRRERATMRRHYQAWYDQLSNTYGPHCQHCGTSENLVLDHIISVAKGGRSQLENLQMLCQACNTAKGKLNYDCRPFPLEL